MYPQRYKYHCLQGTNCWLWATAQSPNLIVCCQDTIKELSLQLAGRLIYENKNPDSIVEIILYDQEDDRWCCFIARNLMTEASAFGFLHFLHHLRDVGVCKVYLKQSGLLDINRRRVDILINHRLQELLSLPSVDGRIGTSIYCGTLRAPIDLDSEYLNVLGRLFHCKEYDSLYVRDESQLEEMLKLIATGRRHIGRMAVYMTFDATSHIIDRIVDYFRSGTQNLKKAISSEIGLSGITEWPALCPKEHGVQHHPKVLCYEYECINKTSGRRFRVLLDCSGLTGLIIRLKILF